MGSINSKDTRLSRNGNPSGDPSTLDSDRPTRPRNIPHAVWELARLHTKEGWLAVEPAVWGACVAAANNSDILDTDLDKDVERTKHRPLPSDMISYGEAFAVFTAWIPVILAVTYYTLGSVAVITFAPIWMLGVVYPLMKRVMPFPHVVIGAIHDAIVFSGWVSVADDLDGWERRIPLFAAVMVWVVCFDVFYATQDYQDDK